MSLSLKNLNVLMNQLGGGSSSDSENTTVPENDWREDYYAALKSWHRVIETDANGRRHDHTPMPPEKAITSLQLGFIEKASRPSKAKRKPPTPPYKHKLCVELWTVPADMVVRHKNHTQWRRFAQLRPFEAFARTLDKAHKDDHVRWPFAEWALHTAGRASDKTIWGLFHDNNGGWNYYDEHLIMVSLADPVNPQVTIWRDREVVFEGLPLSTDFAGHEFPDGSIQTHCLRADT